jgi:hypothetical protein
MNKIPLALLLVVATLLSHPTDGATIGWGCHPGAGALDYPRRYLLGDKTLTLDFSAGAYVQLVKLVGEPDPFLYGSTILWDDILLDEAHIGYKLLGSGSAEGEWWVPGCEVNIQVGDILYVRAYNVPKDQVAASPSLGVTIWDVDGRFLGRTVRQIDGPQNYYFDNVAMITPEPAPLAFLLPGLAVWLILTKRKANNRSLVSPSGT